MVHECAEMQMRIYVDSFRDNAMEDMKKDRGSMESSSGASKSGAGARRSGKSKIGLIALDLDGTTLRSDRRVGERTKAALTEAAKRGVHVVIATGRSLHSLPEEVLAVEGIKYAITSNGAKIVRLEDKEIIYSNCIAPEASRSIAEILKKLPNVVEIFIDGQAYAEAGKLRNLEKYGITGLSADYVMNTRRPVCGLFEFMEAHIEEIENINVRLKESDDKKALWELFERSADVTATSSFMQNLEIGGGTTSKANAMLALADMLGVEHSRVMACGDGLNDLAMLSAAGIAVAMKNSVPEVLEIADFVTDDNDHDGVGAAVEKFAL